MMVRFKSRSRFAASETLVSLRMLSFVRCFLLLLLSPLAAVTSLQIAIDAPPGDVSYVQYLLPHTKIVSSAAVSVLVAEGIYPPERISEAEKNKRAELLQRLVKRDTTVNPKQRVHEEEEEEGSDAGTTTAADATLENQRLRVFVHLDGDGDGQISQAEYFAILGKTEQYETLFVSSQFATVYC